MAAVKSPFLVVENFLSPKICENIVDQLEFYSPDVDADGDPIKMVKFKDGPERQIFERLQQQVPQIMAHYGLEYRGTENVVFEYLAQGTQPISLCENSDYLRTKWVRTKDRDLTGVIFLSDYSESPDFDSDYEVYGGKLEFPQHGFGFNPQRGTVVIYPSGPHFINANAEVIYGDLHQVRFHIAAASPFLYQPADFPGNFLKWFK